MKQQTCIKHKSRMVKRRQGKTNLNVRHLLTIKGPKKARQKLPYNAI